jgi:hypothetical protein
MKRRFALAFGILSLGWLGGPGLAQETIKTAPQPAATEAKPAPGGHIVYGDPGCCPMDTCGHGGGGGTLQAGAGIYYIQPHWDSNAAYTQRSALGINGFQGRNHDFSYDYDWAPRVWVGFTNCDGAGARVRYWFYDDEASDLVTDNDSNGQAFTIMNTAAPLGVALFTNGTVLAPQTLVTDSELSLDVWDLEGTYDWKPNCNWQITFFGGVRYVHMFQNYNAAVVDDNTGTTVARLLSGHNLNVIGPTGGVETRRSLSGGGGHGGCGGCGGGGLSLYGSARTSLLFGHGRQGAGSEAVIQGLSIPIFSAFASRDDLLPIVEAEVGAEFARDMGGMNVFVNAALVGQVWFGAGNSARSTSPDVLGPLSGGPDNIDHNLGFFGLALSAGVRY